MSGFGSSGSASRARCDCAPELIPPDSHAHLHDPSVHTCCSRYKLHAGGVHNPFISKVGVNGSNICDAMRKSCPTRHVFMDFAAQHRDLLDVQFSGMRPILAHTAYKYLINLEVGSLRSVGSWRAYVCE